MNTKEDRIITIDKVEQYLTHLEKEEKSQATLQKYQRDLEKLRVFVHGNEVTKESVLAFKQHLKEQYEASSVNSILAAVNSFFSYWHWEDCRVKRLRIQQKVFCDAAQELTKAEYQKLIAAARQNGQERTGLLLQTLGGTGIRVSELPYITVEAVRQGQAVVDCKGKIRTVFIPRKLVGQLLKYIRQKHLKSGPVFVTRTGKPMHRSNIWKVMKALCETAGVAAGKVYPHNLRHLFARTFYHMKKDIAKLADLLGHSNVETTRGYIISTGNEHHQLVERLGLVV